MHAQAGLPPEALAKGGGEGGIRTHGPQRGQRFSRPPDSATLAPLRGQWKSRKVLKLESHPAESLGLEGGLVDDRLGIEFATFDFKTFDFMTSCQA